MFKRVLSSIGKNPWKAYAESIGADYISGGMLHSDKIIIAKHFYTIQINLGTNHRGNAGLIYTRFRTAYASENPLYFTIKKRGLFSKLWHTKSTNDYTILDEYIISHQTAEGISLLVSDSAFWKQIATLKHFKFASEKDDGIYGPTFPKNEHQLCIEILEEVINPAELENTVQLIHFTVDMLLKAGYIITCPATVKY
jgi:hypothetical protein